MIRPVTVPPEGAEVPVKVTVRHGGFDSASYALMIGVYADEEMSRSTAVSAPCSSPPMRPGSFSVSAKASTIFQRFAEQDIFEAIDHCAQYAGRDVDRFLSAVDGTMDAIGRSPRIGSPAFAEALDIAARCSGR